MIPTAKSAVLNGLGDEILVGSTLRWRLLLGMTVACLAILLVQSAIRVFWVLPQLNQLAKHNDHLAVKLVKNQIKQALKPQINFTYDNAVWSQSYEMAAIHNVSWFKDNYFFRETMQHQNLNGVYFYDRHGKLITGLSVDYDFNPLITPEFTEPAQFKPLLIDPAAVEANQFRPISKTIYISVQNQPAIVVSHSIAQTQEVGPSGGTMISWRFIDEQFLAQLNPDENALLQIHTLSNSDLSTLFQHLSTKLTQDEIDVSPYQQRLYLGVDDSDGEPLMAFSVMEIPRLYNQSWFDSSVVAGLVMLVSILLIYAVVINVRLLRPIERLLQTVTYASRSNDYSVRLNLKGSNELHSLANKVDQLLAVVERQQQQLTEKANELKAQSNTDPLTGLANRRHLNDYLHTLKHKPCQREQPLSLMVIDIDHFKPYNDTYGHAQGDEVLKHVGQMLVQLTAEDDAFVARFGGEEFVIVLNNCDAAAATKVAEKLCKGIEALAIKHRGSTVAQVVTISLGIATKVPGKQVDGDLLFNWADAALYEAKEQGRNRFISADSDT